jgi:hypothetical protein
MATNKKPSTTLRHGAIKAAIWLNNGAKGPFFSATFARSFKDQAGAWRNAKNFGLSDLESLMNVALDAKEWIASRGGTPR